MCAKPSAEWLGRGAIIIGFPSSQLFTFLIWWTAHIATISSSLLFIKPQTAYSLTYYTDFKCGYPREWVCNWHYLRHIHSLTSIQLSSYKKGRMKWKTFSSITIYKKCFCLNCQRWRHSNVIRRGVNNGYFTVRPTVSVYPLPPS